MINIDSQEKYQVWLDEQEDRHETLSEIKYWFTSSGGTIPTSVDGDYYVYIVSDGSMPDNITYIGSGKGVRWKHATSGMSNNYELNRLHHTGNHQYVLIFKDKLTQQDSLSLERDLIGFYNPYANTNNKTVMQRSRHGKSPYEGGFMVGKYTGNEPVTASE